MVSRAAALALVFFTAFAVDLEEDAWGPSDSVHALDSVITVVDQIVKNPHLSKDGLAKAKKMASDVKANIEAVESGKLSKEQAHEKVGAAMKELMAFKAEMVPQAFAASKGDKAKRLAELEKELAAKKAELAKDENMIKLVKLKKELAEKKLMLQKLIEQKANSEKNSKADQDEAKKTNEMVQNLVAMAKGLKGDSAAKKQDLPAPLKVVLATVQARRQSVQKTLTDMEAQEKKSEANLEAVIEKQMPTQGKGDAEGQAKSKSMLKRLKKEEHRKFAKAQALKRIELNELKDAEASIEAHDVAGLQRTLAKIESEGKALQAKAGKFLY